MRSAEARTEEQGRTNSNQGLLTPENLPIKLHGTVMDTCKSLNISITLPGVLRAVVEVEQKYLGEKLPVVVEYMPRFLERRVRDEAIVDRANAQALVDVFVAKK